MNNENLTNNNDEPDSEEHAVGVDSLKEVEFVINLSGGEHVEDLEEHKEVEDNGHVSGWGVGFEETVDGVTIEVLDHAVHDVVTVPVLVCFGGVVGDKTLVKTDILV